MEDYDDFHDGLVEVAKCPYCEESYEDCECGSHNDELEDFYSKF